MALGVHSHVRHWDLERAAALLLRNKACGVCVGQGMFTHARSAALWQFACLQIPQAAGRHASMQALQAGCSGRNQELQQAVQEHV